jgi:hypothetical protein
MKLFAAIEDSGAQAMPSGAAHGFWRWMFLLGVVLMLLRGLNIGYVLHCSQRDGKEYYAGPDTRFYIANSAALFDERPLSPLYRERVGYPFLLAVVKAAGGEYRHLLWLPAVLEIPAVLAMALLGWGLTRRRAVAGLAAVLYAMNPNGYQLTSVLMPDWLNGQVIVMALALLVNWVRTGHRPSGWGAVLLLPVSQMIRPTMFLFLAPLVLLLGRTFFLPGRRVLNAVLCACVIAYPAINVAINARLYGVPNLLMSSGFQMHVCYVSHIRAMERNAENPDSMTRLYFDEKHNVALADPREKALDPYGNSPIRADYASHYNSIIVSSRAFLDQRRWAWIQSGFSAIYRQFFLPPHVAPSPYEYHLYPEMESPMRKLHVLALFFGFCGVMLSIRRFPLELTLFFACCTGIAAMGSTTGWHDSVRVRLLLDLLYTPILAIGLLSLPAWLCFGGFAVAAYLPRRLFHWSTTYMGVASAVSLLVSSVYLLRISGPQERSPEHPG